jgi:dihydropteroate synthase
MHMQGTPRTMQEAPHYDDVVSEILRFFEERIAAAETAGIAREQLWIDPGFGFGKTNEHNYELLHKLGVFKLLELPVLVGLSRKSMICRVLNVPPHDALNGTTALHMLALQGGAGILRVHDVKEAKEVIQIFEYYQSVNDKNFGNSTHDV